MEQDCVDFDQLIVEMEWADVVSTLQSMLSNMGDTTNAPPEYPPTLPPVRPPALPPVHPPELPPVHPATLPPVLPPAQPAGQGFSADGQGFSADGQLLGAQGGGFDGFITPEGAIFGIPNPMMVAPGMYHQPLLHPMPAPNTYNQVQFVNPPFDLNSQAAAFYPNQNASMWMQPHGSNPKSVEDLTRRETGGDQLDSERPYIKRPPNAFVLFMKEHRPKVVAELKNRNNSTVNTVLGQRWRSLSAEEQAPYYEQAKIERQLHAQQYPQWSIKENYGRRRRRTRYKSATVTVATGAMVESSGPTAVTKPECDTSRPSSEVSHTCPSDPQAGPSSETTPPTPTVIQTHTLESTQLPPAVDEAPSVQEDASPPPSGEDTGDPECPVDPQRAATPPVKPAPVRRQPPSSEFNVSLTFGDELLLMPDDGFWIPAAPSPPEGGAVAQLMDESPDPPQVPEEEPVSHQPETIAKTETAGPPHTSDSEPSQELSAEDGGGADAGQ